MPPCERSGTRSRSPPQSRPVRDSYQPPERAVFTFGGTTIYPFDVTSTYQWYTDTILELYQAWLQLIINPHRNLGVYLMPINACRVIKDTKEEHMNSIRRQELSPIRNRMLAAKYTFVFLNTPSTIADGGSHWSLLLIDQIAGHALHYDSTSHGINTSEGQHFLRRLRTYMRLDYAFIRISAAHTPQDRRGIDCGPIVCWITRSLLWRLRNGILEGAPVHLDFDRPEICDPEVERNAMRALIQTLTHTNSYSAR